MKPKPDLKIVVSNAPAAPAPPASAPEQVELPFAVINGEPSSQLPHDLYIPPQALEVFLEAFEGPLDLLLYLIRRQNLDILDIPLAEITRQYMQYIELMQDLQLELAGEYLVMAAKLAAQDIDTLARLERDVWPTTAELKERRVVHSLPQVTLQEMLVAFKEVVARAEMFAHHHIARERLSVGERMSDILAALESAGFLEFTRLFRPEEGRMGVTVTFVAILELMREGLIDIVQAQAYAPLHVRAASAARTLHVVEVEAGADPGSGGEGT